MRIRRPVIAEVALADLLAAMCSWRNIEIVVRALDGDVQRFQQLWTAARAEEDV